MHVWNVNFRYLHVQLTEQEAQHLSKTDFTTLHTSLCWSSKSHQWNLLQLRVCCGHRQIQGHEIYPDQPSKSKEQHSLASAMSVSAKPICVDSAQLHMPAISLAVRNTCNALKLSVVFINCRPFSIYDGPILLCVLLPACVCRWACLLSCLLSKSWKWAPAGLERVLGLSILTILCIHLLLCLLSCLVRLQARFTCLHLTYTLWHCTLNIAALLALATWAGSGACTQFETQRPLGHESMNDSHA